MAARTERAAPAALSEQGGYYTVETYSAEDSVGYLIAATRTRLFRGLDVELRKHGFSAAQWPILRAIADGETPIAADLCRKLNYDTGSMTRMLNRLEEKGVLRREASKEDGRTVRLRITPMGHRIYPKLRDATIRVLNRMVAGFSDAEVKHAHELLTRMHSNMEYVNDVDV
jgi:DNA-binding MarR family transcriptional regulator